MDFILSLFLFIINVFTKKKKKSILVTKIHFLFWQLLLQDHQHRPVLSSESKVLKKKK